MTYVYVVLEDDGLGDAEASVYARETDAVEYAYEAVADRLDTDDLEDNPDAELTASMKKDGWVLYLPYGCEGDSVRVMKRKLR